MKTKIIKLFGKRFLKLELIPISQKGKNFFVTKMSAQKFLKIYTVEPASYDINKQSLFASEFDDDVDYYKYLIKTDRDRIDSRAFQRKEDTKRVMEISRFLENEEFALFPNTIIVTCDLLNDFFEIDSSNTIDKRVIKELDDSNTLSFIESTDAQIFLYVPYKQNAILIIDGQHRVKGLEKADPQIQEDYDLLLSFIIGYDRATVAKLFYTINYTQKSVSKSLLYHLTGEFSQELNEITFMHETVKLLNELDKSPFHRRIKMLGNIPKDINEAEKKYMTISQAFLIDYLKDTILEKSRKSIHQPIFLYYYRKSDLQIEIIRFVIKYFNAIKQLKMGDWETPEESIICRTVSVGAFLKTLHLLFVKIFVDDFNKDPLEIRGISTNYLKDILGGIQEIDFSREGEFGRAASAGSLGRLKEKMVEKIDYFNAKDYTVFIERFKTNELPVFRNWLEKKMKI